ncbi:MAG: tRNA 2-selenouridine(34) synthase MnmH [Mucilaginibacter sp.]|uniref:tRNA 2-selenouridine(34) synthase MnmH n=1 Tax=Mucilaginibacter sp. TaxID=1882438 RepID=UPI0034E4F15C
MTHPISVDDFIRLPEPVPLADVRTPAEFLQGHVPGAFNLPLFSNEERVKVGTTYKQGSREEAILLGFDLTGNKWSGFIREALKMAPQKKIAVHCWRGGMRSGAMAWALNLYGFEVYLITGGYKNYRRWALKQFETLYELCILGGMTGSGKTKILQQFKALGEQIIDLEELAQHQGSSYGTLGTLIQPTQEQFENNLAFALSQLNKNRRIWVEDESLTIGKRFIPNPFWHQMRQSVLVEMKVPHAQRTENLVKEYGRLNKEFLIECTQRIAKRLGPEQTRDAIAAIREDRMEDFIKLVLVYYDKTYQVGLSKRNKENVFPLAIEGADVAAQAKSILNFASSLVASAQSAQ